MRKILLLSSNFSEQDSVTTITKNIITAYKHLAHTKLAILCIEKSVAKTSAYINSFDFIIVIHPMVVLSDDFARLLKLIDSTKLALIFHIFGDFIRKSAFFVKLNDLLINKKVHFVAASQSYKKLLQKALINPASISVSPFPLESKNFLFDSKLREKFRKKNSLTKEDFVLLYTGRVSPQKNILFLMKIFSQLKTTGQSRGQLKLFIYGNVDEFEVPTFYEKKYLPGEYYQKIQAALSEFGEIDINFIPRNSHKSLKEAYNGSDLYVSMSLYHDEDFGYSPLESLLCGTPVLLTAWGGYRDLTSCTSVKSATTFIPVSFKDECLEISEELAKKNMFKAIKSSNRSKIIAKDYSQSYSTENIAKVYDLLLKKKIITFKGYSEDFINLSLQMYLNSDADIKLYQQFYESFWKSK